MDKKKAFGRGLRQLRLIRGLSQEAFTPAFSLSFVSVVERGAKMISIERIDGLAETLDVHPLTLLTAMYVGEYGVGADELFARVKADFASLAAQPPSEVVGKHPRSRADDVAEAKRWLHEEVKVKEIARKRGSGGQKKKAPSIKAEI